MCLARVCTFAVPLVSNGARGCRCGRRRWTSASSRGFVGRLLVTSSRPRKWCFFQAEDGIRDIGVTGVQTCALPICLVSRRAPDQFELGVNIAATPGAVVFRNELMELIQYSPTTETVYKRPLLFVPPTVNKFYLFDLTPKSSYVKWLVDQGHTVFLISWVNPDEAHRDVGLADYVKMGPLAALDAIEQATGEKSVDLVAY